MNRLTRLGVVTLALILAGCIENAASTERHALLIGIGAYPDSPLKGPPEDVRAVQRALVERWGFKPDHIQSLLDAAASRAAILAAIDKLAATTQPGDEIFIYFSGHGTSPRDARNAHLNLPAGSGAIIPVDFKATDDPKEASKRLIVGRTDLVPRFQALDRDRQLLVVFDSCFAGNQVRSYGGGYTVRSQPVAFSQEFGDLAGVTQTQDSAAYPYKNLLYLAASGDWEEAMDIDEASMADHPTRDGKFHGAFSDALLRALHGEIPVDQNHDGQLQLGELAESVRQYMAKASFKQDPQVLPRLSEDHAQLRQRGLFGAGKPSAGALPAPSAEAKTSLKVAVKGPDSLKKIVAASDGVAVTDDSPELRVSANGSSIELSNGSGDPITTLREADLPAQLKRRAEWHHIITTLRARQPFGATLALDNPGKSATAVAGERINLAVQPEKSGYLLLLDLFADGSIKVLYPNSADEAARPIQADRARPLIDNEVTPPFGVDHVIALVFPEKPAGFDNLTAKLIGLDRDSLAVLQPLVAAGTGKAAVAELQLKTYPSK